MDDGQRVLDAAQQVADSIARRDLEALSSLLAEDFSLWTAGEETRSAETFLAGIAQIPGEILFVRLEELEVNVHGAGALVTGFQRARLRIDGEEVEDRRSFVDWFVRVDDRWLLRVAVDPPSSA